MSKEEINQLDRIEKCLIGDKLDGRVGLIDKVDGLDDRLCLIENRISNLEKKKSFNFLKAIISIFK